MTTPTLFDRLRLPVIGSPLFIISGPELVIAQCKAGIVGSFPALNARPQALLDEWLHQITEELAAHNRAHPDHPAAPFAVNQIVHKSNDRLEADLATCAKWQVPIVITSLGAREDLNTAVHGWGGITLHDVIDDRFARKAIEKGADGLIAVAAGAGGHAGRLSPFAIIQEIRQWFDGPLALSGSIATGGAILAAQAMGADFAYIGSPFIATTEANAAPDYKASIVASKAADIVYSNLFTGVHGNYLRSSIEAAGLDPDHLPEGDLKTMNFGGNNGSKAKAWRDIWGSGQGIGVIDAVESVADRVDRFAREYAAAKARIAGSAGDPAPRRGQKASASRSCRRWTGLGATASTCAASSRPTRRCRFALASTNARARCGSAATKSASNCGAWPSRRFPSSASRGCISPASIARCVSSQAMTCISRVVTFNDSHEKPTRISGSSASRSSRPASSK